MSAVVWAVVALLALLILYPLITTVVLAVEDALLTPGAFTLNPAIPFVLSNTAIEVIGSAVLALLFGALFAAFARAGRNASEDGAVR